MTISELWSGAWSAWTAAFINHLLQSTAVVLIAWICTLALRSNRARVRYAVWMFASAKFLVPFSLLVDLGAHLSKPAAAQSTSTGYILVEQIRERVATLPTVLPGATTQATPMHSLPLLPEAFGIIWLAGSLMVLAIWFLRWRRAAELAQNSDILLEGREVDAVRRAANSAGLRQGIPIRLSTHAIEPGVFGIFRPVLLWPAGLSARLNDVQIEAVMAHELEHVMHRDNLTAAIHKLVEALFWFHPAVHWMGTRMNEERERACDEKVVAQNAQPEVYAESILEVCEFCVTAPIPCVSGVSGGDLKQRIRRIMTRGSGTALSAWRKAALAAAAVLTLAVPLGFGATHGQTPATSTVETGQNPAASADLPKYDVASIKPYKADDGPGMRVMMRITPDGVSLQGVPLRLLVQQSLGVEQDRIFGEPTWINTSRYNIEAKVEPEEAPKLKDMKAEQRNAMMLQLLVDRFHMKYHYEKRELPLYTLVVAKSGLKMKPSKPDENLPLADAPKPGDAPGRVAFGPPPGPGVSKPGDGPPPRMGKGMMMMNPGHLESTGTTIDMLAHVLSRQLGRTVVDKTGLTGNYDFTLDYTPDNMPMPMPGAPEGGPKPEMQPNAGGPSLFTAVQEQLGLKLEATKATVDVVVIDHIDQPSEN